MNNMEIYGVLLLIVFWLIFFLVRGNKRKLEFTTLKMLIFKRYPFVALEFCNNRKYVFVMVSYYDCGVERILKEKCKIDDFDENFVIKMIKGGIEKC